MPLDLLHGAKHPDWDGVNFENTTVILIGDNGSYGGLWGGADKINRDSKGSNYEGGLNVPLIVSGYGVDPAKAGTPSDALVHGVDVLATALDLVGADWQSAGNQPGRGRSLLPFLRPGTTCRDDGDRSCARETVYTDGTGAGTSIDAAIRDDEYKLIWDPADTCEFFHLAADPSESNDLETGNGTVNDAAHAARFDALRDGLEAIRGITEITCAAGGPPPPACGLGPELVLLVSAVMILRRRLG